MAQVKINHTQVVANTRHTLKKIKFDIQKKDGSWESQSREVYDHGNAATALLYNQEQKTIVLIKQFRIASYLNGNTEGMLTEACAGLLEENENPEKAIIREIEEETGYSLTHVQKIYEAYSSPGCLTELIHYYVAAYTKEQQTGAGGGLAEEQEELDILELPYDEAMKLLESGAIKDAKTIILLLHVKTKGLL